MTIWPWRASFSTLFHPVTQRLLSIYALHREIGLNAYVKDPIKVARRTPCDVSIASGKPGTHMPWFPSMPRPSVVANPLSKSYQRLSSPTRREVENFLRTRNEREKIPFSIWQFLWHALRIVAYFAAYLEFRLPSDLTHLYAI